MSYGGLGSSRRRERSQRLRRIFGTLFLLVSIGVFGLVAYLMGIEEGESRLTSLQASLDEWEDVKRTILTDRENDRAALEVAQRRLAELQSTVAKNVIRPEDQELIDLFSARIAAGVSRERLRHLLTTATEVRDCDEQSRTRRFLVETAAFQSAKSVVSFAGDTLTIGGSGEPTLDAEGKPLAAFDPAKPVTISFTSIDGRTEQVEGQLPLNHSVVLRDREYQFNISAGPAGFISVTGLSCAYP